MQEMISITFVSNSRRVRFAIRHRIVQGFSIRKTINQYPDVSKKNIYILQIIMLLLLYSCNSNHFRFDDNNQEIISTDTYFSEIEIENISTGECFTIRRKKMEKKSVK